MQIFYGIKIVKIRTKSINRKERKGIAQSSQSPVPMAFGSNQNKYICFSFACFAKA
jgi:hypothetical protein